MKDPVWTVSQILNNHGDDLTAILLALFNQIGLGPDGVEYADGHGKLDGFGLNDLTPGAHIRIHWRPESIMPGWKAPEEPAEDSPVFHEDGYIFTLPSMEGNDVAMAGVVHIPSPTNWDGATVDPQWFPLNTLLTFDSLDHIELLGAHE
jgi:hypothetical protein